MKQPDPATVDQIIRHLQSGAGVSRFFEKATSSTWIVPLRDRGVFDSPEDARDRGGSVTFPTWPQAEYLERVTPQAPTIVAETIERIPDTDNIWVLRHLANAMAKMPWAVASRFVSRLTTWISVPNAAAFLMDAVAELVPIALDAGDAPSAVILTEALLDVHESRPARHVDGLDDHAFDLRAESGGLLNAWEYRRSVEALARRIADVDWRLTIVLLSGLLDRALQIERGAAARELGRDLSHIWYRRLDGSGEKPLEGVKESLVEAVVAIADDVVAKRPSETGAVVNKLMESPWPVMWRVALRVLATTRPTARDPVLVARLLGDHLLFDHIDARREYNQLLAAAWNELGEDNRHEILSWAEDRPEWLDGDDTDGLRRHQRDRLAPLAGQLPVEWERRYQALVDEYGQPRWHEGLSGEFTSWMGPTSPLSAGDLSQLSVPDVIEFLRTWTPTGEWTSPTPEGLGRALSVDVATRACDYIGEVDRWDGLSPTMTRSLVVGVTGAISRQDISIEPSVWEFVLRATKAGKVADSQASVSEREPMDDEDPSWGWFRREVVRMIEVAADRNAIAPSAARIVMDLLEEISGDENPTTEEEARFGDGMGPVTYAINTTRGQAVHSVIAMAAWLTRNGEEGLLDQRLLPLLATQLDDPSPAVHCVFGMRLIQLAGVRQEWLIERLPLVFASDSRGDAAWAAYVEWNRVWLQILPGLWPYYVARAKGLGDQAAAGTLKHLFGLLAAGATGVDGLGDLLALAWSRAPDDARARCLHGIAERLHEDIPIEERSRCREFLSRRMDEIQAAAVGAVDKEVGALGWLLARGQLDPHDVVSWLPVLLTASPKLERENDLFTLLATYVERGELVEAAVDCTRLLFETDHAGWASFAARGAIGRVVNGALKCEDGRARRAGEELRDYLLSTGRFRPEWITNPPPDDAD